MRKKLLAVVAAAAMAVTMMPAMVFAAGTPVEINGNSEETAVQAAVTAAKTNPVTIEFTDDYSGNGVVVQNGQTVVFDLGGNTWDITDCVGSSGTETNGMQLLNGSTVTIKNGKITSEKACLLIQNYCNLTLEDVTLDGSNLKGLKPYTLSNNTGNTTIGEGTKIIAHPNGVAFDVYFWPEGSYTEGPKVTIENDAMIQGDIECDRYSETGPQNNSELTINGGRIDGEIIVKKPADPTDVTITGGDFSTDVSKFLTSGLVLLATYYDTDSGDKEFHYWPVTKEQAEFEARVLHNGIYYIDVIDAVEMGDISINDATEKVFSYKINFWGVTPTGLDTGKDNTFLSIPKDNDGIAAYLKDSGEEIVAPAAVDGYKFIGWYAAADNNYEWTGDNDEQLKNFKYGEKIDMNARVTEDTEYFAAWEKIDAGEKPEKSPETGDESNMAVPFAAAGLALAAMAAAVAARRRHN